MKRKFIIVISVLSICLSPFQHLFAQATTGDVIDTTISANKDSAFISNNSTHTDDEPFNIFLLFIGVSFICAMVGAAIIGAFGAALFLLLLFLFVVTGIASSSIVVGLHKRSLYAGFKTFVILLCAILGTILLGFLTLLIVKTSHLHYDLTSAFIAGAAGGCIGGISIGAVIAYLVKNVTNRIKIRLGL